MRTQPRSVAVLGSGFSTHGHGVPSTKRRAEVDITAAVAVRWQGLHLVRLRSGAAGAMPTEQNETRFVVAAWRTIHREPLNADPVQA